MEKALIKQYESDIAHILPKLNNETIDYIVALAELPTTIRGFGPVKRSNVKKAADKRKDLLNALDVAGNGLRRAAE